MATVCHGIVDPINRAFVEAGTEAGFPVTEDVNGFQQEGFGPFDMNIGREPLPPSNAGYPGAA